MHTPIANHAPAFPSTGVILDNINSMEDLRRLSVEDLGQLSVELRNYIIHTLATHPGHLASPIPLPHMATSFPAYRATDRFILHLLDVYYSSKNSLIVFRRIVNKKIFSPQNW